MNLADLSPVLRVHAGVAIADHIRQLRRDGRPVPPGLPELGHALLRNGERNAEDRRREQAAARMRRYRARRKVAGGPPGR